MSQKALKIIQSTLYIAAPVIARVFMGNAFSNYKDETKSIFILPASYAFSIWAPIYIGMFAFTIWDMVKKAPETSDRTRVTILLIIVAIADCAFPFAARAQNGLWATLLIVMHLIPLAIANHLLRTRVAKEPVETPMWVYPPISMFLAWISAATVISFTMRFYFSGWQPSFVWKEFWAILLIVVLTGLAAIFAWLRDYAYTLVVVWALIAVAVAQWSVPAVGIAALVAASCLGLGFVYLYLVLHRSPWWVIPLSQNKGEGELQKLIW